MKLLKYGDIIVNMDNVQKISYKEPFVYFYTLSTVNTYTILEVSYNLVVKALKTKEDFVDLEELQENNNG